MKTIKVLLLISILWFFSSCMYLSKQPAQQTLPTEVTITNIPLQESTIPTPMVETSAPTDTKVIPTPVRESLIPDDLREISVENIGDLKVFGEIPYKQIKPKHNIFFMALSNDGTKLGAISEDWENRDRSLVVWDLVTNAQIFELKNQPYFLSRASFSADDRQLRVVHEGDVDQYDLQQIQFIDMIETPEHDVIAFSPDESYFATGVYHGSPDSSTVQFYVSGSDQAFFTEEVAYMITAFYFSPDSKMVASYSSKIGASVIKIWDVESGALIRDLYHYDGGPVFSSGADLAAFVKEGQVSVFSTDSWVLKSSFQLDVSCISGIPQFFLGDDQILAISDSYDVSFRSVSEGRELLTLPDEGRVIRSPALDYVVTYGRQDRIKLWGIVQE